MNHATVHKKMPVVSRGGRMRYNKPCERCGQMMHNVGVARKYCDECVLRVKREQCNAARKRYIARHRAAHQKNKPLKDIRTCVREAEALGMSYGNYVAAGLDQVAWEGQRQTRPRTGSPIQMDHTHGGDADGSDDL